MKLTDLDPRWLIRDGRRIGFIFRSPVKRSWYQSCLLEKCNADTQRDLFNAALRDLADEGQESAQYTRVQGCRSDCAWKITEGSDFTNLSVTPSIDGSAGGLWHGYITGGEIR